MKRFEFIDGLRGGAIILMVINHAGHYLVLPFDYGWNYLAIYWTVALAAPIFLFLVGFSAALFVQKNSADSVQNDKRILTSLLKRGLAIIALGFLVNLLYYNGEPLWRGRVLMTIGLSLILIYPFTYLIKKQTGRIALLAISISGLMSFPIFASGLQALSAGRPIIGEIFLSEFPIYPWFFLVLIGLIAGREFLARKEINRQARKLLLAIGAGLIFFWLILSIIFHGANIFSFYNDIIINNYWNPAPITWLWILGWISILTVVFYGLAESKLLDKWLIALGRQSIFMYFLQFLLIIIIGQNMLRLVATDLLSFIILNILIIIILCLSAKLNPFASSIKSSRPKARARIF